MLKQMQLIAILIVVGVLGACSDDRHDGDSMKNHQAKENNSPISAQMRALEQAKGVEQMTQDSFEQRKQEINRQSE